MRYREIGTTGIKASVVALGAWQMGGFKWGGTDINKSIKTVHAALDAGINFIDTAPSYGLGMSEEVVGKAIKGRREEVVLGTKCGLVWHLNKGIYHFEEYSKSVYRYLGADSIRYEVEQSLKRLGSDYIDLYQTHRQDPTTPVEETMEVLLDLQREGKIRAIGVSNISLDILKAYKQCGIISSIQELYSMMDRDIDRDIVPFCHSNDISVLAYSPLAKGLLTGKIMPETKFGGDDQRIDNPRFSVENIIRVQKFLDELKPLTENHNISLSTLVIAWTLSRSGVTHVICGTQKENQAVENALAGDLILASEEISFIDTIVSKYF